jgi:hypothetical protein
MESCSGLAGKIYGVTGMVCALNASIMIKMRQITKNQKTGHIAFFLFDTFV